MLIEHAQRELDKVGLFDKDSDYEGMLGDAVMELQTVFANQGHSGMSAMMVIELFNKVARYDVLSPITSNPDEWMKLDEYLSPDRDLWQSKRKPSLFSNDGGKTWYDVEDSNGQQE